MGVFNFKVILFELRWESTSFKYDALKPISIVSPSYDTASSSCAFDAFSGSSVAINNFDVSVFIATCCVVLLEKIETLLTAASRSFRPTLSSLSLSFGITLS